MSFLASHINQRERKIHFNGYKLEVNQVTTNKIDSLDDVTLDFDTDLNVKTESQHDLVQENYLLSTFLKDQIQANHQYQSRITELEQKLQVLLSTQSIQPQVNPPDILKKLVVSGDLFNQFQNAVSTINNPTTIDLSFYLQHLWKIEIEGYSNNATDLANLTITNNDTSGVIVDTGLWSQTSDKYEMTKTILQANSRIQDVRYMNVEANWNAITLTGITFYYKMNSHDPDDIGIPDV